MGLISSFLLHFLAAIMITTLQVVTFCVPAACCTSDYRQLPYSWAVCLPVMAVFFSPATLPAKVCLNWTASANAHCLSTILLKNMAVDGTVPYNESVRHFRTPFQNSLGNYCLFSVHRPAYRNNKPQFSSVQTSFYTSSKVLCMQ